jgi:hypothetical protein
MVRMRWQKVAVLALGAVLVGARWASADGGEDRPRRKPPRQIPSYSRLHFWAPGLVWCYEDLCGPRLSVYAPDRHPELPPSYLILRYRRRRPAPPPEATLVEVPTPPPESRAR